MPVDQPGAGKGLLCTMNDPTAVQWFARGRMATLEEVNESIDTGFPLLLKECRTFDERQMLLKMRADFTQYLPGAGF